MFICFKKKYLLFFIYIAILININYNYNYRFKCEDCIFMKNIRKKCYKCSYEILLKNISVLSVEQTLNEIIKNNKSIARFGDGEFDIIFGLNRKLQQYNITLKEKLLKVLNSNMSNLLIGIMPLTNIKNKFWIDYLEKNKFRLSKVINKNKVYYSSMITRFYHSKKNKTKINEYITKFKSIWNNRNILIIEGEKTRLGIGNNLFNNSKSIKRIICPIANSFRVYNKILEFTKNLTLDKNTLILISLGQTATALTYDLQNLGNQIIDFGHFDIQYEYFLRNVTQSIRIPYKFVNEVKDGGKNIISITDNNYYKQIIYKIE